jgi:hypothetical protein
MNNPAFPAAWKAVIISQAIVFGCAFWWCTFPIPYWDMIDWILSYLRDGIAPMFTPDNEHRVAIPRLLIAFDIYAFRGALWPLYVVSLSALAVLCALIGRAAAAVAKDHDVAGAAAGCALAVCLLLRGFSITDYFPINLPHLFAAFFAVLGCAAIASRPGWPMAVVALMLALASAWCQSSGLVMLPVLAWLAWRANGNIAIAVALVAACVIVPALYVQGMSLASLDHAGVVPLARFIIEYFGVPWTRLAGGLPVAWLEGGVIVVTLSGFLMWATVRKPASPALAFLLGVAAYMLGVALLTGLGRAGAIDLQSQGIRYGIYAEVAQAVCFALLWPWLWRTAVRLSRGWQILVTATVVALLFAEQVVSAAVIHRRTGQIAQAAARLCAGSQNADDLLQIYPDAARALDFMHEIEHRKLYCFR